MITKSLKLNLKTRVPGYTQDDDLSVEMPSLEQCFDRNEPLHSAIIPDRGLFAPESSEASPGGNSDCRDRYAGDLGACPGCQVTRQGYFDTLKPST